MFINDGLFPPEVFPFPWAEASFLGVGYVGEEQEAGGSEGWIDVGEQKVVLINCISPLIYNIKEFCEDLKDCPKISQIREV